jgi:hypothetical protein
MKKRSRKERKPAGEPPYKIGTASAHSANVHAKTKIQVLKATNGNETQKKQ